MGAFLEGEWESLCNIFTFDTPDFGAHQFLDHPSNNNYSSFFTSSINNNECFSYDPTITLTPNSIISDLFSDNASDTTSYNNIPSPISNSYENCQFSSPKDAFWPMINSISMMDQQKHASFSSLLPVEDNNESENLGTSPLNQEVHVKRKYNASEVQADEHKLKGIPKKKARLSKNNRGKNIIESMTIVQEIECNVGEEEGSDDESKVSLQTSDFDITTSKELMSETSKGKQRASRGTATDPQSLYARKRRMRINERLKILQNLVPNGTKVDISTMLEEAVNYVKFLQLQIQLLSSDDLWMYAPIAYNGVDMNLYKRISPFLLA